jgi:hypothetical protein
MGSSETVRSPKRIDLPTNLTTILILIGRLKGASSKRLKEKGLSNFGWQNRYGAFSVSESNLEYVTAYIRDQARASQEIQLSGRDPADHETPPSCL